MLMGCCQGHLQRKLFVPPVHAQPTVTTSLRSTSFVIAMHRHVDFWALTKGHQNRSNTHLSEQC